MGASPSASGEGSQPSDVTIPTVTGLYESPSMKIRDMFASDDEAQRERVNGPSLREVAARQEEALFHGEDAEPHPTLPDEFHPGFWAHLPGDDKDHPCLPPLNPYLFVPPSELVFLLKKKDLSAESRQRIAEALSMLAGA